MVIFTDVQTLGWAVKADGVKLTQEVDMSPGLGWEIAACPVEP